ncbi:MAG: S-layer family protein [Scytonema sp. CRU_2_7]|nr:S-layer family protein [Scytonema sp. CRU_2_7]
MLTINVPIGLQFGQNPGRIEVQGTGYDLSAQLRSPIIRGNSITGLQVQPGKTLALVGGDIDLEGGTLTAEQGRIELGSIGNQAQVSLNSIPEGFALDYQGVQFFRDIRLSQQASADASGGGAIQVQGNNVRLTDGSIILIQNQGEQRGGQISVNAAQSLEASGPNPVAGFYGGLEGQTIGVGSSADIVVSTQQLVVRNGAAILTRSFSPGRAGNVTVNASDSIQVIDFHRLLLL